MKKHLSDARRFYLGLTYNLAILLLSLNMMIVTAVQCVALVISLFVAGPALATFLLIASGIVLHLVALWLGSTNLWSLIYSLEKLPRLR